MSINTTTSTPDKIKECLIEFAKNPTLRKMATYIHGEPGIGYPHSC